VLCYAFVLDDRYNVSPVCVEGKSLLFFVIRPKVGGTVPPLQKVGVCVSYAYARHDDDDECELEVERMNC